MEEYLAGSPVVGQIAERLAGIEREYQELDTVWFMVRGRGQGQGQGAGAGARGSGGYGCVWGGGEGGGQGSRRCV